MNKYNMDEFEIELRLKLYEIWNVDLDGVWCPINSGKKPLPKDVQVFQDTYFEEEAENYLVEILKKNFNLEKLVVLKGSSGYEIQNIDEPDWYCVGLEKLITNTNGDFCLYASHESSFTIGSKLILEKLQKVWPEYHKRIWTTPFYE